MDSSSIRPPQWVTALALLAAVATFAYTLVTTAPQARAPLGEAAYSQRVRDLFARGEWSQVVDLSRSQHDQLPGEPDALFFLAWGLEQRAFEGDADEAARLWGSLAELCDEAMRFGGGQGSGDFVAYRYYGGWAQRKLGAEAQARALWREAADEQAERALTTTGAVSHYIESNLWALVGQRERALDAWHRAITSGYNDWAWMQSDPDLVDLRRDPAFEAQRQMVTREASQSLRIWYAQGVDSGSFDLMIEVTERHMRERPMDFEARLFRAYALEAAGVSAVDEWTALAEGAESMVRLGLRRAAEREMPSDDPGAEAGEGVEGVESDDATPDDAAKPQSPPSPPEFRGTPEAMRAAGIDDQILYYLAWGLRGLGDLERSQAIFALLADNEVRASRRRGGDLYNRACAAALAGRREQAVSDLVESLRTAPVSPRWARVDPDLDPIRDDPRVIEAMDAFGLPVGTAGPPEGES